MSPPRSDFSGSAGAAIALNTINTNTSAYVESSSLTVTGGGAITIDAQDASSASALTGSASVAAGIISIAAGGSAATDNVTDVVAAYIDASNVAASGSSVTVEATATPEASATAYGVAAGSLAVGGSVAIVNLTPTVTATVGGPNITVGNLSIIADVNLPSNGPSGSTFAGGSTGGIVAVVASDAETTNNATITSGIGSFANVASATGMVVVVGGALLVVANGNTQQNSNASNASIGLIAAGIAKSVSSASNTTTATVGSSARITTGTMSVSANGNDNNFAATTAGAGGVAAGVAVSPTTSDEATTTATIGAGTIVSVLGGSISSAFSISAAHLATADTQVIANAVGFLSGAGASASNDITSNVTVNLDGSVSALSITGHAENDFNHPSLGNGVDNLGGDTAGLASAAGGTDTTLIDFSTIVDVGSGASLNVIGASSDAGNLALSADNTFQGYDQVTFKTGGAFAGAQALSQIQTYSPSNPSGFDDPAGYVAAGDLAEVHVEAGATLISVGQIDLSADGSANLTTQVNTDTYGAVTVAAANSNIDLRPDNEIVIGTSGSNTAATLTAYGDVDLLAGEDALFNMDSYTADAYVDAFAGALIPISSVNAHAYVVQTNRITVYGDATLNTGGDANLMANTVGLASVFAQAKTTSWASDVQDAILSITGGNPANQFNGTAFSTSHGIVDVDGAIHTGISSNLYVTFSYANIQLSETGNPGVQTLSNGEVVDASDGNVYRYIGTGGSVNLTTTDYSNAALWEIIPGDIIATVSNFSTAQASELLTSGQSIVGDGLGNVYTYIGTTGSVDLGTITFSDHSKWQAATAGTTPNYLTTQASLPLTNGNTVYDTVSGNVYRYQGPDEEINLGNINFGNGNWIQVVSGQIVGGTPVTYVTAAQVQGAVYLAPGNTVEASNGAVYKYLGFYNVSTNTVSTTARTQTVNLNSTDFTNQSLWQLIPANIVGVVVNFTEGQGVQNSDDRSKRSGDQRHYLSIPRLVRLGRSR